MARGPQLIERLNMADKERIVQLETAIKKMDLAAEVGLCCFTLGSIREYLKDVRRYSNEVGIKGGITEYKADG